MNKQEMIKKVAAKTDLSERKTEKVIDEILNTIMNETSAGRNVMLRGFGTFSKVRRSAMKVPCDGKMKAIRATSVPKFKPGTVFKRKIKKK